MGKKPLALFSAQDSKSRSEEMLLAEGKLQRGRSRCRFFWNMEGLWLLDLPLLWAKHGDMPGCVTILIYDFGGV